MSRVLMWTGVLPGLASAGGEALLGYCDGNVCAALSLRGCSAASFWQFQLLVYSKCTQNTVTGRDQYSNSLIPSLCVNQTKP
jgi:hypothetical protein